MNTDISHPPTPRNTRDRFRAWAAQRPIAAILVLMFSIGYPVMAFPVLADHGVIPAGWMPQSAGLDTERIASLLLVFVALLPTSVAAEADMKPGNRKGTNPGPPDRTRRTRRTAIVLSTPPPVLNDTAANCGPPFGTKRPQVQILSPRPVFPQVRAPHQNWWGPRLLPVQQQNAASTATNPNFDILIERLPPAYGALC